MAAYQVFVMPLNNVHKHFVEGVILLDSKLPRGVRYNGLKRLTLNASERFVSLQLETPTNGVRNDGNPADIKGWYLSDCEIVAKDEQYSLFDGNQIIGLLTVKMIGPSLEPGSSV